MFAPSDSLSSPQRRTLQACAAIGATVLALVALGHDGRRVAQLLVLALPVLALLLLPLRSERAHHVRTGAVWLLAMAFVLDGAVRAYLLDRYQAAPDSSLIQSAAANTNGRESAEYLSMQWRTILLWTCAVLAAGTVIGRYAPRGARLRMAWPRWMVVMLCVMLLVGCVAYLMKPWRRLHPVFFWSQWNQSVNHLRVAWADQQAQRDRALANAKAALPVVTSAGPATLMLVITDSINRDNLELYGYQRSTTPRLLAHKAQLQDQMLVVRNAWSVDASTLPALRNMFNLDVGNGKEPQHLLALARAAGYKVWWMSNHDDVAIEQEHARLADVVDVVNRTPGRAGASLDGELLDCVQEALEDPAERKLIVVHLLGAHPHYHLRFPPDANPFDDQPDEVDAQLEESGRSIWVRKFRQEYDAALLYHDFVVSETLQLARTIGRADGYRAWMYLSDHGQEVGHGSNHVGHSPSTASGYRIPTIIWRNSKAAPYAAGSGNRPFRADWTGWTMADLLNLQWTGDATQRNILREDYQWVAPQLPVAVSSFEK